MNKKEYITPIMETYQIKAQSLLTGSVLDPPSPIPSSRRRQNRSTVSSAPLCWIWE